MSNIFPSENDIIYDRYLIKKELELGIQSRSFKALDKKTDSLVNLKIQAVDDSILELLPDIKSEAEYFKKCDFPHIVKINDFFIEKERLIISMNYMEGRNLLNSIKELGTFSSDYVLHIAKTLCEALVSLHKEGITHQNINPSNIFFDTKGKIWLTDILSSHNYAFTRFKSPKNVSLPFVPPEVFNSQDTDTRWDIYSLGMCLFYALLGELPQEIKTMFTFGKKEGIDPRSYGLSVDEKLAVVIKKCTSSSPAERFSSAQVLLDFLNASNVDFIKEKILFNIPAYKCLSSSKEIIEHPGVSCFCDDGSSSFSVYIKKGKSTSKNEIVSKVQKIYPDCFSKKKLREVASGERAIIFCSEVNAKNIISNLKEVDLSSYTKKRSNYSLIPVDVFLILLIINILSIIAYLNISSDYLISSILISISLAFIAYRVYYKPLITRDYNSLIPKEIKSKIAPLRKKIRGDNLNTILARTLLIADNLYRIKKIEHFQVSRVLMKLASVFEDIVKIDESIQSTLSVNSSEAHPSQLADFRRILSIEKNKVFKIYDVLKGLYFDSLVSEENSSNKAFEEVVDEVLY